VNINKKNKGFTLIEILLVIGFISILGLGVYIVYDKVNVSSIANDEARNIKVIQSSILNLYAVSKNYSSINIETLIAAKAVPGNMRQTTTQLSNGFGGSVNVSSANYGGFINKSFSISYGDVPKGICMRFIALASITSVRVTVNGIAVKDASGVEGEDKKDLSVPLAVQECDKVENSTVVFTFY
jgi:prepilin-type N-terminal cleavage/methylation domain-containing protein